MTSTWKNKLFAALIVLVLAACVFLTLTPVT